METLLTLIMVFQFLHAGRSGVTAARAGERWGVVNQDFGAGDFGVHVRLPRRHAASSVSHRCGISCGMSRYGTQIQQA